MPPPPEVRNTGGEVGERKVLHEFKSKQSGGANGNIGITGKVAIDLKTEQQGTQQQRAAIVCSRITEYKVDMFSTIVSDHYLFKQAPENLTHASYRLIMIKTS